MKAIILLFLFLGFNISEARREVYETVKEYGVWKTKKKELDGVGFTLIETVRIKEDIDPQTQVKTKKISVFFGNCKEMELKDQKAQSLNAGDHIRFRMTSMDSCQISSWEKIN